MQPLRPTDRSLTFNWISVGMLMSGLFLPIAATMLEPSFWSNAFYAVALMCWVILPVWYPCCAIRTGVIGGGYRVFRRQEPFKFWLGLATYEVLLLVLSIVIALPVYARFAKD